MKKRIGLIVNPVAGVGGKAGFKGSDGEEIQRKAFAKGIRPEAHLKARAALSVFQDMADEVEILTYRGNMGQEEAEDCGFSVIDVGAPDDMGSTREEDTKRLAGRLLEEEVDLIIFAGGDGTARIVSSVIGEQIPVVGIPAGVKIHSGVYAINPRNAGRAVKNFITGEITRTKEAEVMDLDEELYRKGVISPRLYGYMRVPDDKRSIQNVKMRSVSQTAALDYIATDVIQSMEEDVVYLIGAGTTTRTIMILLDMEYTLIGIDAVCNGKLLEKDLDEARLWDLVSHRKCVLITTVIGGQGHVFGRGNQQLSPRVIRKLGRENIEIIATKEKLLSLPGRRLLLDTGDAELDKEFSGYAKVITGLDERTMCKIEGE